MHEIVTLQFGHYANFVGTHFWNTQEAHFNYQPSAQDNDATPEPLDHDCLYRTGITNRGTETYTPRAMIFDLKGGFGSINKYRLYESESALDHYDLSWDPSKMETFQEEEYSKSAYQKHLEEEEMGITMEEGEDDIEMNEIKTWSNFSRVYFHPKSMVNVSGYQLNSEFMPFDVFSYGRSAFVETEKEKESYDENFRLFTEECDQLQGFQVMADILDGWGGFATSYLEQLREDFPKATVVTYGLSDNQMRKSSTMKESQISAVNEVLSMTNLSGLSSFYIPIRAPSLSTVDTTEWSKYIQFDPSSRYHTSAIISAGIDSALLPCRLRHNVIHMPDLVGLLNWRNITTIGTLSVALPFPFGAATLPRLIGPHSPLLDLSSWKMNLVDKAFSHSLVLRGLEMNQFTKYTTGTQRAPNELVEELLGTLPIGKSLSDSRTITALKYPIPTSYPRFFKGLTLDGYLETDNYSSNIRPDGTSKVNSMPTLTRLAASSTTRWQLQMLSNSVKKIDWRLLPQFQLDGPGSVCSEEFTEAKEIILDMYDIYNE